MNLDTNIYNDPNDVSNVLELIFNLIGGVVKAMQDINLFAQVSLFDFCVALSVMSIVITYLVNVAKRPQSETGKQAEAKRKESNK